MNRYDIIINFSSACICFPPPWLILLKVEIQVTDDFILFWLLEEHFETE